VLEDSQSLPEGHSIYFTIPGLSPEIVNKHVIFVIRDKIIIFMIYVGITVSEKGVSIYYQFIFKWIPALTGHH
jgi:hypothetical protein